MTHTTIDEKLALVTFHPASSPHIAIDPLPCVACPIDRICISVCPAQNYSWDDLANIIHVATTSCFECGTCRVACTENAITWQWPMGGFGVMYSEG